MKKFYSSRGFSLVEVTLSLGIVSFCMLTLLAMVSIGIGSSKDSLQKTAAAGFVTQIADDLTSTPATNPTSTRFQINLNTAATNTIFFASDGSYSGTTPSLYQATIIVTPPAAASGKLSTIAHIIVTWPGLRGTAGAVPSSYQGSYETVTALDRN